MGVEHWMDAGVARSTNSNQTPNTIEIVRETDGGC